ncbi:MAG: hypothetical protein ACQETL_12935 [Bacteroidota bacterium]
MKFHYLKPQKVVFNIEFEVLNKVDRFIFQIIFAVSSFPFCLIKKKSARGGPAFGWEKIKTIRQLADYASMQHPPRLFVLLPALSEQILFGFDI